MLVEFLKDALRAEWAAWSSDGATAAKQGGKARRRAAKAAKAGRGALPTLCDLVTTLLKSFPGVVGGEEATKALPWLLRNAVACERAAQAS